MSLGTIEGGGTKFLCAVGDAQGRMGQPLRVPTTDPEETLGRCVEFFRDHRVGALGVGMFGPLELSHSRPTRFGATRRTPKPGWDHVPVLDRLRDALGVPVAIDTDVNAAALGEWQRGAGQGADNLAYVTVGTGFGAGVLIGGEPIHGLVHPELGHLPMPRLRLADGSEDSFAGTCPYHGRCLEGLVAGPAVRARCGTGPTPLRDAQALELWARYVAHGLAALVLTVSPSRIVLSGGVVTDDSLRVAVAVALRGLIGAYLDRPELDASSGYIVAPGLGSLAGLHGGLLLAARASSHADAGGPTRSSGAGAHGQQ